MGTPRKTMAVAIENEGGFIDSVKQYAENDKLSKKYANDAKKYKQGIEDYALGGESVPLHLVECNWQGEVIGKDGKPIYWAFPLATPAIRLLPDVTLTEVCAKLTASRKTKECVVLGLNSDKIRDLFMDKPEALKKYGLMMTDNTRHFKATYASAREEAKGGTK